LLEAKANLEKEDTLPTSREHIEEHWTSFQVKHPNFETVEVMWAEVEFEYDLRVWDEWHSGAWAPERLAEADDPRNFRLDDVDISYEDLQALFGPRLVDELIQKGMDQ
jgi:hypothetical protein